MESFGEFPTMVCVIPKRPQSVLCLTVQLSSWEHHSTASFCQAPILLVCCLGSSPDSNRSQWRLWETFNSCFCQVNVAEDDKNFLHFLWWSEGNVSQEPVEFRMAVHLFGAVFSTSCASYALRKPAEDNHAPRQRLWKESEETFNVGNCLKSLPSEEVQALTEICSHWNLPTGRQKEEHIAKDGKELNLDRDELPLERAPGLKWYVESDALKFEMVTKEQPQSKWGMLPIISSGFNHLGFLSPITMPAKLCRRRCGWDYYLKGWHYSRLRGALRQEFKTFIVTHICKGIYIVKSLGWGWLHCAYT